MFQRFVGSPPKLPAAILLVAALSGLIFGVYNLPIVFGAPSQPNIVLIVSDDQRADGLQWMPQVAALSANSYRFNKTYAATALCCPSRTTILSGRYAHNHGVHTNGDSFNGDTSTIATWLQAAGYKTGLIGKYLNSYKPTLKTKPYIPPGWDTFQAFKSMKYYDYYLTDYVDGVNKNLVHYGTSAADYSTDVIANKAIGFINQAEVNDSQPFFAYVAPWAPHNPATPAPRHASAPANIGIYRPPSFNEVDVTDKPVWVRNLAKIGRSSAAKIDALRVNMYRATLALDDLVQNIVNSLIARDELSNTVIIYISDNGWHWGEHRIFNGKDTPYEEAAKLPLIIYDGRNPASVDINALTANVDLAPTIADLAGVAAPATVDGYSLLTLMNNQAGPWRSSLLQESWDAPGRNDTGAFEVLRDDRWVYVDYYTGEKELYDLVSDPYELVNVASDPANATRVEAMHNRLLQLKTCQGSSGPASCN